MCLYTVCGSHKVKGLGQSHRKLLLLLNILMSLSVFTLANTDRYSAKRVRILKVQQREKKGGDAEAAPHFSPLQKILGALIFWEGDKKQFPFFIVFCKLEFKPLDSSFKKEINKSAQIKKDNQEIGDILFPNHRSIHMSTTQVLQYFLQLLCSSFAWHKVQQQSAHPALVTLSQSE